MRKLGLIAAMEADIENEEVESAAAGMPDTENSVESKMLETNEAGADVADATAQIDENMDMSDELEGHMDIMEDSLENGGMTADAARTAELAVESIYARLGVTRRQAMPSMESFGAKGNRIAATKLAIEGIAETLKTVWESIKAAFLKMSQWIKDFFAKFFDAVTVLDNRAKKLEEMADKITGSPEKATIPGGSFAPQLVIGKAFSVQKTVDSMKNVIAAVEIISTGLGLTSATLEQAKGWSKFVKDEKAFDKVQNSAPVKTEMFQATSGNSHGAAPKDCVIMISGEMPGNRTIVVTAGNKDAKGLDSFEAVGQISYVVGKFDPKAAKVVITNVPTLTKPQLTLMIDGVKAVVGVVVNSKKFSEGVEASRDQLLTSLKDFTAELTEDKAAATRSKAIQKAVVGLNRVSGQLAGCMNTIALGVGKAALTYVEKSVKEYKAA